MRHPKASHLRTMSQAQLIRLLEEADADYQDERSAALVNRIEMELDEREIMNWDDQDTTNIIFDHNGRLVR
jgi:hypothetical protein